MHIDSGCFLQVSKQTDENKNNFMIELVENPKASRVVFQIHPRYKYRQEGDRVVYDDHITIFNVKTGLYI